LSSRHGSRPRASSSDSTESGSEPLSARDGRARWVVSGVQPGPISAFGALGRRTRIAESVLRPWERRAAPAGLGIEQLVAVDVRVARDRRDVGVAEVLGDEARIAARLAQPGRGSVAQPTRWRRPASPETAVARSCSWFAGVPTATRSTRANGPAQPYGGSGAPRLGTLLRASEARGPRLSLVTLPARSSSRPTTPGMSTT
jgi:hypothetical protein